MKRRSLINQREYPQSAKQGESNMFIQTSAPYETKASTECDQFPPSLIKAFAAQERDKARFDKSDARLKAELRAYADANRLPFVRPETVRSQIDRIAAHKGGVA
jgi:hypothetical protein